MTQDICMYIIRYVYICNQEEKKQMALKQFNKKLNCINKKKSQLKCRMAHSEKKFTRPWSGKKMKTFNLTSIKYQAQKFYAVVVILKKTAVICRTMGMKLHYLKIHKPVPNIDKFQFLVSWLIQGRGKGNLIITLYLSHGTYKSISFNFFLFQMLQQLKCTLYKVSFRTFERY